jgi:hypothetical protein
MVPIKALSLRALKTTCFGIARNVIFPDNLGDVVKKRF